MLGLGLVLRCELSLVTVSVNHALVIVKIKVHVSHKKKTQTCLRLRVVLPDECVGMVLHPCGLVHGFQPGGHVLLGVGTEVIRSHASVLCLRANHRALLVNVRAHTSVASLLEERRGRFKPWSEIQKSSVRQCRSERDRVTPCCPITEATPAAAQAPTNAESANEGHYTTQKMQTLTPATNRKFNTTHLRTNDKILFYMKKEKCRTSNSNVLT